MDVLRISICTYEDGVFEVMFEDNKGNHISFDGEKYHIPDEEYEFLNKIAPPCVWTTYKRLMPEDE